MGFLHSQYFCYAYLIFEVFGMIFKHIPHKFNQLMHLILECGIC